MGSTSPPHGRQPARNERDVAAQLERHDNAPVIIVIGHIHDRLREIERHHVLAKESRPDHAGCGAAGIRRQRRVDRRHGRVEWAERHRPHAQLDRVRAALPHTARSGAGRHPGIGDVEPDAPRAGHVEDRRLRPCVEDIPSLAVARDVHRDVDPLILVRQRHAGRRLRAEPDRRQREAVQCETPAIDH
jgi:hypothetical protein